MLSADSAGGGGGMRRTCFTRFGKGIRRVRLDICDSRNTASRRSGGACVVLICLSSILYLVYLSLWWIRLYGACSGWTPVQSDPAFQAARCGFTVLSRSHVGVPESGVGISVRFDTELHLSVDISARPLNKLADEFDFYGTEWLEPLFDLSIVDRSSCAGSPPESLCASHTMRRKSWEFAQLIHALRRFDVLTANATGLGVGSGHESILFYLAKHARLIVAGDLYDRGGWSAREGASGFMSNPRAYAPAQYAYRDDHLQVVYMDGSDLLYPAATFDFVFCMSSIEHFYTLISGFHATATRSIIEMARVTRKGGVVFIATEVIINAEPHYDWLGSSQILPYRDFFLPSELESVLIRPAREAGLELSEPLDYSLSSQTLAHARNFDFHCAQNPHIILHSDEHGMQRVFWTSVSLAFRKVR